ncbi:MAG: ribosome-associated translation inhibitor RaiA [Syntrophales bacterium]|nr:ribosome-associated translation inhibitor RaiA [Syntrophales bacterium]
MKISLTFKNIESEDWFRKYVEERLGKLSKYLGGPVDVHVVLSVEKFRNVAEINLSDDGLMFFAKEEAKEMVLAIDEAVEKIERQLKKHREKVRGYKVTNRNTLAEGLSSPDREMEGESRIVETRRIVLEPMSHEDAIMKLETSKNRFVVFRDASTEAVCVLYKRDDGHYMMIQTVG